MKSLRSSFRVGGTFVPRDSLWLSLENEDWATDSSNDFVVKFFSGESAVVVPRAGLVLTEMLADAIMPLV